MEKFLKTALKDLQKAKSENNYQGKIFGLLHFLANVGGGDEVEARIRSVAKCNHAQLFP
jgi:hypothetical protein